MFRSWRKQLEFLIVAAITFASLVPAVHAASAPNIVTYQGRVLNANGVPVSNSSLSMSFALYTTLGGGTCVWSNSSETCASVTAQAVTLTNGLFTENLGGTGYAAIGDSIFGDNAALYLEVIIAGETLAPRRQITAAPYALNADTLDGIDSATLQLFETGSSRTFEDDAPVIIGTNAALTYGSGGVGDLRVEDELEVMGDGYIDNDLVVGASTSSTETITNVAFTLGGDDLFVAGTMGVEGNLYTDGDVVITGDDLFMGTNTSGFILIADGTNFNPVDVSGDIDISSAGLVTIQADAVALSTDTTGNYVASVGTSVLTGLTGGAAGSEGAALSLALDYSQALSGDVGLSANAGVFGTSGLVFEGLTADTIETFLAVTDPTATDKTITVPNLSGTMILSGHTFTGDVTATLGASNTTALTIAADSITLATDTTGNYVATVTDAGSGDIAVVGSGSENAAVTLDITDDALDFTEFEDTLDIDAATEINLGTGGLTIDLDSTGEFAIQDGASDVLRIEDVSGITTIYDDLDVTLAGTENMTLTTTTGSNAVDLLSITITNTDAGAAIQRGLVISNDATSSATTDSLISLDNADAVALTDGLIILASGGVVTDAIDATASSIVNALNFGTNVILGTTGDIDMTSFDVVGASGNITTAGTLAVNGDSISADGVLTIDAAATIQLGSDDDFLPQLGAGDAEIGASGTRWDSVYAVAGNFSGTATVSDLSCTDCLDFTELVDALSLDASTSITMDGAETFTITDGGTGNVVFNLSSTGDFVVQDNGVAAFTFTDVAVLELATTAGGIDMAGTLIDLDADNDTSIVASTDDQIDIELGGNAQAAIFRAPQVADALQATLGSLLELNYSTPLDSTGTNLHSILVLDLDIGNATAGTNYAAGLVFESTAGDAQVSDLHALDIGDLTGTAATNETAIEIGSGWDAGIQGASNATLLIRGGFSTGIDDGEELQLVGGTNDTSTASGGAGGMVRLTGGAATGNGSDAHAGGDVVITGGASSISTGSGGNVKILGGASTTGADGNVVILSDSSASAPPVAGGDVGISTSGDFYFTSADDVAFRLTSSSAIVNLFDSAFSKTIDIGSVDTDAADTISIATNGTTADTIAVGNTNATTSVTITAGGTIDLEGAVTIDLTTIAATQYAVCHTNSDTNDEPIGDCSGAPTADYAEQYPVAEGIEYGDIVVPGAAEVSTSDGETIVQLVKSSQAYQGPIVGIVSNNYGDFTSAGYNIAAEDNPMPVALVGRVPVKVTSEGGSISVGDYLTTSSIPGKAMKATKVGRVIGMALEDWDGASPTLMVQVNNSWSMGDVLGTDGTSTLVTDNVIVSSVGTASANEQTFDSYGLSLRGSAWNGSEAQAVEMMLQNVVDDEDAYRLSVRNTTQTEVAYITNEGAMKIAGDMVIGGRLYLSDRGKPQTEKYIYYDGSSGPGGDFMRTNAKGWSTGSYDFAEMFPSGEKLVSGDLVVFAGSGETVGRATGADGEQLAGIVSTRPGFLAGGNVAGAYPIALAGRVPTKVSTANGAIVVGDPLTASTTAGVAMKASEAGQIIGYALESYTGSESDNLILTYVNVGYWSGGPQTITIVQNQASQMSSDAQGFSALNMSGSIYMATNSILSIGRLEGVSGIWSIESDGTIKTDGSLKTVTQSYQGTDVETIAVTSPESVITLTGTSTLVEGRAEVRFEDVVPQFNDVISAIAPIRVIVTPSGPISLYVSEKDQNHFVVERFVGSADVEFDWMVTGYRKGYEPVEEELSDPSVLLVPSDLSTPITEEEPEPVAQEEPAPPESPDTTQVDSPAEPGPASPDATQDDGGQEAEPSDVVIETPSTPDL